MYCKQVNITGFLMSSIKVFYKIKYLWMFLFRFNGPNQQNNSKLLKTIIFLSLYQEKKLNNLGLVGQVG